MNVYNFLNYQEIPCCPVCKEAGQAVLGTVTVENSRIYTCPNCGETWMEFDQEGKVDAEQMMYWRPMKAGTFRREKHEAFLNSDHHIIEQKENGDRVIAVYSKYATQFFTRTLSRSDSLPVEKTEWLPHLHTRVGMSFILDGEIEVAGHSDHTQVNSLFNCELQKSLQRQQEQGKLIYVVFDILMFDGEDVRIKPLDERLELRAEAVEELRQRLYPQRGLLAPKRKFLRTVVSGMGEKFVKSLLTKGYEGAMIKDLSAEYMSDQRTNAWLKIKEEETLELFIMGYKDAKTISTKTSGKTTTTKYAGQVGSIELGAYDSISKSVVSVCYSSGIPDDLRLEITKNKKEYLQEVVQVKCQRVTKDKLGNISLQNPRIMFLREDKNWKECLYSDLRASFNKKVR